MILEQFAIFFTEWTNGFVRSEHSRSDSLYGATQERRLPVREGTWDANKEGRGFGDCLKSLGRDKIVPRTCHEPGSYRGRNSPLPGRSPLRTAHAGLPHTALQLVVFPLRDRLIGPVDAMERTSKADGALDGFTPITEVAGMRFQLKTRLVLPQWTDVSGVLDLTVNLYRCVFRVPGCSASTSLPPFAPRPLRRFNATMKALTPARVSLSYRSPCLTHIAVQTIPSPNTLCSPVVAFSRYVLPLSATDLPVAFQLSKTGLLPPRVQASPLDGRLAETPGRNGFVILRTGRSPPVALHPASQRRSYRQLQVVALT